VKDILLSAAVVVAGLAVVAFVIGLGWMLMR
jgi:hypothetical protein